MVKPKVVLLIFVSGKIVLTGAKVQGHFTSPFGMKTGTLCSPLERHFFHPPQFREEIYAAFAAIYPVLSEFRKP